MHKGRADVETVSSLPIPQILRGHGVIDDHFATQWPQRRRRKIKWSIEILPCGDVWIECGLPQEVKHKLRLDQELVPHIFWKIRIDARENRLKVCFECADGTFGYIPSMQVGR